MLREMQFVPFDADFAIMTTLLPIIIRIVLV